MDSGDDVTMIYASTSIKTASANISSAPESLIKSFSGFVTKSSPRSEEGRGRAIRSPFRTLALAYPKLCVPPVDDEVVHRNWENLIAFLVNVIYMKIICSPPDPSKENLGWSSPRGDWDLSRL